MRCREVGAELQTGFWGWKLGRRGAGRMVLSCRQVTEDENWNEEVQGGWCWAADKLLRMRTGMKRCREVGVELQTSYWGWELEWRGAGRLVLSCRQVAEDENKDEEVQGGWCWADRLLKMKTRMKRCRDVGVEQTGCWRWKQWWRGAGMLVLSRQVAEDENKDEEVQGGLCWAADKSLSMRTGKKRCREVDAELQTSYWVWELERRGAGRLVLSCRHVAEDEN